MVEPGLSDAQSFGQPQSHELPTRMRREEVAISLTNMAGGCGAGDSAQHQLIAHEFPVVCADQSRSGSKSGIPEVSTRCPLPDIAEPLRLWARSGLGTKF